MIAVPTLDSSSLPGSLQSLSPDQARFCLKTDRFLQYELGLDLRGSRILAAFSGGADSTALLLTLRYLAPRLGFTLHAAHLDHRLRPGSADEANACRHFCRNLAIPILLETWDKGAQDTRLRLPPESGVEDAARSARYAFFNRAATHCGADWIATGHNANDLAEDVLMRLTRGTGWPGLSGMTAADPARRLLRPLLLTPRSAVEKFLRSLGTGWLTDESNCDKHYFRNRVRLEALPFFCKENPAFLDAVAGLWRLGRIDAEYFTSLVSRAAGNDRRAQDTANGPEPAPASAGNEPPFLPRAALMVTPKALRLRLYKHMLDALGPGQALMAGLLALDEAFTRNEKKTEHLFPGGKRAVADAGGILWLGAPSVRPESSGIKN